MKRQAMLLLAAMGFLSECGAMARGEGAEFQRQGIGESLLRRAEQVALAQGVVRLEAWTRDDTWVRDWYKKLGFSQFRSYLHVFVGGGELTNASDIPGLRPVAGFAHYTGPDFELVRSRFQRVHECVGLEKQIKQ